jgi:hypothetical protein
LISAFVATLKRETIALDPAVEYITGNTFNVDGGMAMGC